MKKFAAILLALALVLSMTSAWADNTFTANVGAEGTSVTWTDTFKISTGDNARNLPAATFEYEITAISEDIQATANNPLIKKGVGSPTINPAVHAKTAAGTTTDSVDVTADFSGVTFTEAGIYRYNVIETLGTTNVIDDILIDTQNDNKGKYTLDVYVKKEGTAFTPYAYILAKVGANTTYDNSKNPQTVVYDKKVSEIINEYTTYDLTITKEVQGDVAANEYQFTVDLAGVPEDVVFNNDNADETGNTNNGNTIIKSLANGGKIELKGLPSTVTYKIKEAVNQLEGYQVTVTDNNPNKGNYGWIVSGAISTNSTNAEEYGNPVVTILGENDTTVAFVNKLNDISPTGVVLRVAPYALILAAGIALLMISRKRKAEED